MRQGLPACTTYTVAIAHMLSRTTSAYVSLVSLVLHFQEPSDKSSHINCPRSFWCSEAEPCAARTLCPPSGCITTLLRRVHGICTSSRSRVRSSATGFLHLGVFDSLPAARVDCDVGQLIRYSVEVPASCRCPRSPKANAAALGAPCRCTVARVGVSEQQQANMLSCDFCSAS